MSIRAVLIVAVLLLLTVVAGSGVRRVSQQDGTAPPPIADAPPVLDLSLEPLVGGLERPLFLTHAGDGSGRLFVVEQAGRVRVIRDGRLLEPPFLDIRALVGSGANEQGLLSIAFHPQYHANGVFYVDYTDVHGDTVIARYRVSDDADEADARSAETVLWVDQPATNHNGGLLRFGPGGYLYIGMGDGGGGTGSRNGQALDTVLGKILRIDVDRPGESAPYAIPADNPFVDVAGARPEIWLSGLRNPWRFSFDPADGTLVIGDVGAAVWEELTIVPAGVGGLNLGWNVFEGSRCNVAGELCAELGLDRTADLAWPALSYRHGSGECAITGGHVYRGDALAALRGVYLFADYCSGRIWGLVRDDAGRVLLSEPLDTDLRISSFGLDEAGELYVVDLGGAVYLVRAG